MERIPSREIYWNIPEHLLLYVLLLPFLAVFLYGCYRRFVALLLGRKGVRLGQPKERLKAFVSQAVLQGRIATERYSGVMHLSLSWGFLLLLFLAVLVTGFLVEGLRIMATADPWGPWSPGGWVTALLFRGVGVEYAR